MLVLVRNEKRDVFPHHTSKSCSLIHSSCCYFLYSLYNLTKCLWPHAQLIKDLVVGIFREWQDNNCIKASPCYAMCQIWEEKNLLINKLRMRSVSKSNRRFLFYFSFYFISGFFLFIKYGQFINFECYEFYENIVYLLNSL